MLLLRSPACLCMAYRNEFNPLFITSAPSSFQGIIFYKYVSFSLKTAANFYGLNILIADNVLIMADTVKEKKDEARIHKSKLNLYTFKTTHENFPFLWGIL